MSPVEFFVVYDSPSDYPGRFVVRRFVSTAGRVVPDPEPVAVTSTLEIAREVIPIGLVRLSPRPDDDQAISEVWL